MTINQEITQALDDNDHIVITGKRQGLILKEVESITGSIGRCLGNGSVFYSMGKKKIFVGDMPYHPSLSGATRIEL